MAEIFWGKEKDPPILEETPNTTAVFLRLGHSDVHQIQVVAPVRFTKTSKKILLGWNAASYSELYSYSDF